MSFEFDVFVSYSRRDSPFVDGLAGRLRDAGFKVWFDIEQVPGGADVQQALRQGLNASRHLLVVVTEHWQASNNTTWEAATFQPKDGRVLVPLARIPFDAGSFGASLHRYNSVSWPPGDPQPDARFWEVYCALLQKGAGPKAEWAQKGAALGNAGGGSALLATSAAEREVQTVHRARWGPGGAVFCCDRAPQWNEVCTYADSLRHEALFVVGPRGEAHELFLETLSERFPTQSPRVVITVHWLPAVPASREGFRAELADSLGCREAELAAKVRSVLRDQNLVVLHRPVMAAQLRNEGLIRYYTRWLPELIGEVGPTTWTLKAFQGIDWCPAHKLSGSFARIAGRLGIGGRDWIEEALQQEEVERALQRIREEADKRLPVFPLAPLIPITPEDVKKWSVRLPPEVDREEFIRDVLRGAKNSSDILYKIVERLSTKKERA